MPMFLCGLIAGVVLVLAAIIVGDDNHDIRL